MRKAQEKDDVRLFLKGIRGYEMSFGVWDLDFVNCP
jgi:hypothetical protein